MPRRVLQRIVGGRQDTANFSPNNAIKRELKHDFTSNDRFNDHDDQEEHHFHEENDRKLNNRFSETDNQTEHDPFSFPSQNKFVSPSFDRKRDPNLFEKNNQQEFGNFSNFKKQQKPNENFGNDGFQNRASNDFDNNPRWSQKQRPNENFANEGFQNRVSNEFDNNFRSNRVQDRTTLNKNKFDKTHESGDRSNRTDHHMHTSTNYEFDLENNNNYQEDRDQEFAKPEFQISRDFVIFPNERQKKRALEYERGLNKNQKITFNKVENDFFEPNIRRESDDHGKNTPSNSSPNLIEPKFTFAQQKERQRPIVSNDFLNKYYQSY